MDSEVPDLSRGVPEELVATEKQPDACEFFNRHRGKYVATTSVQGANEDKHRKLSRLFFSSSLEASFTATWTRPEAIHP